MYSTRYSRLILMKIQFSLQIILINPQIPHFIKIRPVIPELFHADRRTHMMKKIRAFRNFQTRLKTSPQ